MTPDPRDTDPLTVADDPTEPPPLRWGCFFMALGAWLAWRLSWALFGQ